MTPKHPSDTNFKYIIIIFRQYVCDLGFAAIYDIGTNVFWKPPQATEVDNDIIESAMQYEKRRVSKHTTETKRNECISNHTAKNKKECVVCVRKIATIA